VSSMTDLLTCGGCGIGFRGRSDAIYCSSACRQKAHRARTARRIAALAEPRSPRTRPQRRLSKPDVAVTIERARREQSRSRELCRAAADTLRQTIASQRSFALNRESRLQALVSSSGEGGS
jgi:hypothetical protein